MLAIICAVVGCTFSVFFTTFFGSLPLLRKAFGHLRKHYIPPYLGVLITKNPLVRLISACVDHITSDSGPTALVLWLSLTYVIAAAFLSHVWTSLAKHHQISVSILLPLPYVFACLCTTASAESAHVVTPASHEHHVSLYPYDYKLYYPTLYCDVCRLVRPARSKHCSRCRVCVARMDHHCIWVNNCIGRGNHKYFLALLLSVTLMLAYGSCLAYTTLPERARTAFACQNVSLIAFGDAYRSPGWLLRRLECWYTGAEVSLETGGTVQLVTGMFAFPMSFLPAALLVYQLNLLCRGMTTYESGKRAAWRKEAEEGRLWVISLDQGNVATSPGMNKSWPRQSREMVVSTHDGLPPHGLEAELQVVVAENGSWKKCMDFDRLENIYNVGFWRNVWEILRH